jgi:hypothetical protein
MYVSKVANTILLGLYPYLGPTILLFGSFAAALQLPGVLGKFAIPAKHPDFNHRLRAATPTAAIYALVHWMGVALTDGDKRRMPPDTMHSQERPLAHRPCSQRPQYGPPHPFGALIAFAAALIAFTGAMFYPIGTPWLIAALVGYAALLWRYPGGWLFVIPALLPVLDLSPLTGRLLLDEFDLIILVTLAMSYLRTCPMKPQPWPNRTISWAVALLWISWSISSARGLWPLWENAGSLSDSSHSPLDAWRVGKGLLWALLLIPLIRRIPPENSGSALRQMSNGLIAGLALLTLALFWERHVYAGTGDFEKAFRITGTFASLNTGGAYIEAFIAFAFPALVVLVLTTRKGILKLFGIVSAVGISCAMPVTLSPGGYIALIAGLVPVVLSILRQQRTAFSIRQRLVLGGVLAASVAAAVPALSGGFTQSRLAQTLEDLTLRGVHWKQALDLMDDGLMTVLVGMGFGQYPVLYTLGAETTRAPGTYAVMRDENDENNSYLRLGAGETVFLDQIVNVEPGKRYVLTARIRQPSGDAALSIPLCEKALVYSFECIWSELRPKSSDGNWSTVTVEVNSGKLGEGGNWPYRPVKLSLHNTSAGTSLDVDDVSLKTNEGRELVANGGFDDGTARWLLVTNQKEAWHIDQQEVEVYFAQGALGLSAMALLLIGAGKILWPSLVREGLEAAMWAGTLLGFLAVGLLGSTMDAARLSMLFYLFAFSTQLLPLATQGRAAGRTRHRRPLVQQSVATYSFQPRRRKT